MGGVRAFEKAASFWSGENPPVSTLRSTTLILKVLIVTSLLSKENTAAMYHCVQPSWVKVNGMNCSNPAIYPTAQTLQLSETLKDRASYYYY